MKTLSPQITGVAQPLPGILTFHLMWLVSLQAVGGLAMGATPLANGPRHCGQFWSVAFETSARPFVRTIPQKAERTILWRRVFTRTFCSGFMVQIFFSKS